MVRILMVITVAILETNEEEQEDLARIKDLKVFRKAAVTLPPTKTVWT